MIDAAATKPFGFTKFTPGPGGGGHGLPVDPMPLSWKAQQELGMPFRFAELAADVDRHMPDYVVRRLVEALNKRDRVHFDPFLPRAELRRRLENFDAFVEKYSGAPASRTPLATRARWPWPSTRWAETSIGARP